MQTGYGVPILSTTSPLVRECSDCGLLNQLAPPRAGVDMHCVRCGTLLRRVPQRLQGDGFIWALASVYLFVLTLSAPLVKISLLGEQRAEMLGTGPLVLDDHGFWLLAAIILMTSMVAPATRIIGYLVVLVSLRLRKRARWLLRLYALLHHLQPWVMIEVYLLGYLVAYSRLQSIGHVQIAAAVVGLAALMLSMTAMESAIDSETLWQRLAFPLPNAGPAASGSVVGCDTCFFISARPRKQCPRCGDALHHRKPDSLTRASALTLAAAILYVPSNIVPVMTVTHVGIRHTYTIYGGIRELAAVGLWPLAVLVFIVSIGIPLFKLITLAYLLWETRRKSAARLHGRTQAYRLVEFIGRWSMVDVFVVSILAALVRFGWIATVSADSGVVYFASVVVLTLLAARAFDPRLMWDAAGAKAPP